jgi:hypothetical protein
MPDSALRVYPFACGWEYPAWSGYFYPEDLPEAWRLAYFANEFRGVLVPAELWRAADQKTLLEWADSVHEAFRFYIELNSPAADEHEQQRAALLGTCFAAWVVPQPDAAEGGVTPCRLEAPGWCGRAFLVDADRVQDLQDARNLLEWVAAQQGGQGTLPLFLQGADWPIERLRRFNQLSELLGLA